MGYSALTGWLDRSAWSGNNTAPPRSGWTRAGRCGDKTRYDLRGRRGRSGTGTEAFTDSPRVHSGSGRDVSTIGVTETSRARFRKRGPIRGRPTRMLSDTEGPCIVWARQCYWIAGIPKYSICDYNQECSLIPPQECPLIPPKPFRRPRRRGLAACSPGQRQDAPCSRSIASISVRPRRAPRPAVLPTVRRRGGWSRRRASIGMRSSPGRARPSRDRRP